jgi:hypothetical protein
MGGADCRWKNLGRGDKVLVSVVLVVFFRSKRRRPEMARCQDASPRAVGKPLTVV